MRLPEEDVKAVPERLSSKLPRSDERRPGIRRFGVRAVVACLVLLLAGGCTKTSSAPFPLEATIPELQDAMETGELTAVELVDFYLARIAAYDDAGPKLNAFILVNPRARDEAVALDAERALSGPRGPLHGIPVVVKDNIDAADMPTTAGSLALKGFIPDADAFQVRKLRKAGAIIIGKTNLDQFAQGWTTVSSLEGQTLSPYDLSRDPGGSSGGSAVAVTANFAVAGFGTDSCGSVRFPASLNDLYGLRPTIGLSSRTGLIPPGTDAGTRWARWLAASWTSRSCSTPPWARTRPIRRRCGSTRPTWTPSIRTDCRADASAYLDYSVDPEVDQLIRAAIDDMEANGVEVVEVTLPIATDPGRSFDEFGHALHDYLAAQHGAPVRSLREIVDLNVVTPAVGGFLSDLAAVTSLDTAAYRAALKGQRRFRDAVVALMDEHDLDAIAYPASSSPAALIGGDPSPFNCESAAYGGLPALVVPAGFTSDGLPIGLELMGRPFAEPTLIAVAAGYEAHTDHRKLPAATPPLQRTE